MMTVARGLRLHGWRLGAAALLAASSALKVESITVEQIPVQRLREHNVPLEEIFIPDEIHDFLLWKTVLT